jgi:hypothetical protein
MALGLIQPLTEMNTRCISRGKGDRCVRLTKLPPSCVIFMKSGTLSSWNSRLVTELLYFYLPYSLFRMYVEVHHILLTMLTFVYSIYILRFYIFLHSYRAYRYYQSFLFTNEYTSDCLKNNIKIYIKIAPTCFGAVTPSSGSSLSMLA